ncbi:MAG TPA: endonuclease/exonuclease/phosphatase family protein [Candidatus Saccharimonadales bacterium]|nr:endonuclease/exonuclease/phosphatase family protein [Candidatus Saccharimonadales bacterium]
MARAFSVVSWNVEHFGALDRNRRKPVKPLGPIIRYLASQQADVVAIYEVVSSIVYDTIVREMPDYQYHITEGPQVQEILVGVRKSLTGFFTQRLEFKSGQTTLRPGALLTLRVGGESYPLLFLHLKSLRVPKGFGLRDDMTERALAFRETLDDAAGTSGRSNYIFLGDLNTMGMNLTFSDKDISGDEEIERLRQRAAGRRMTVLAKSDERTYWPGSSSSLPASNLDHVVAARHLTFKSFAGSPIDVRGWPQEPTARAKDRWARTFSDHALLYFEVQRV